jgi:hypothetical protein
MSRVNKYLGGSIRKAGMKDTTQNKYSTSPMTQQQRAQLGLLRGGTFLEVGQGLKRGRGMLAAY